MIPEFRSPWRLVRRPVLHYRLGGLEYSPTEQSATQKNAVNAWEHLSDTRVRGSSSA
jgi:hypothetical protein